MYVFLYYNPVKYDSSDLHIMYVNKLKLQSHLVCRYLRVYTSPGWDCVHNVDTTSNVLMCHSTKYYNRLFIDYETTAHMAESSRIVVGDRSKLLKIQSTSFLFLWNDTNMLWLF